MTVLSSSIEASYKEVTIELKVNHEGALRIIIREVLMRNTHKKKAKIECYLLIIVIEHFKIKSKSNRINRVN